MRGMGFFFDGWLVCGGVLGDMVDVVEVVCLVVEFGVQVWLEVEVNECLFSGIECGYGGEGVVGYSCVGCCGFVFVLVFQLCVVWYWYDFVVGVDCCG